MFHGDGGRRVDVNERDGVTHVPCLCRGGRWRSRGEVREDEGGWRAGTLGHRRAVSGRGGIGCG